MQPERVLRIRFFMTIYFSIWFLSKKDEGSQSEDTQINFDEPLTERKAKINRKEIVESEDSDKLSSEEGVSPLSN